MRERENRGTGERERRQRGGRRVDGLGLGEGAADCGFIGGEQVSGGVAGGEVAWRGDGAAASVRACRSCPYEGEGRTSTRIGLGSEVGREEK